MPAKPTSRAQSRHYSRYITRRRLIQLVVIGMAAYLIAAGFGGLSLSLTAMRTARMQLVVVAAICVAGTYICASLTYYYLAAKRIRLMPTLLVQISGGLVNRLLPAGLGGLGINALYLKNTGHTLPAATAIVASNNLLGFIANGVLVVIAISLHPSALNSIQLPHFSFTIAAVVAVLIIAGLTVVIRSPKAAQKSTAALGEMVRYFHLMSHRPVPMLSALMSSVALTSLHATALYLVITSLGIHVAWTLALFAVSVGSLTGAAVPTPGGIGGTEAGIAAALLAFNVPSASAVAAALLYRLLTYWIPMLPGYAALRIVEKRYLY